MVRLDRSRVAHSPRLYFRWWYLGFLGEPGGVSPRTLHHGVRGLTPPGTHFVIHPVSGTALATGSFLGNTTPPTGG